MLKKPRLYFALWLTIALQVFSFTALADFRCTPEEVARLLTARELPQKEQEPLLHRFLSQFQELHPDDSTISKFRIEYNYFKPEPGFLINYEIKPFYKDLVMGSVNITIKNETMRFDIKIFDQFKGLKLYAYLMAMALKDNPNITSIPSVMPYPYSDNAVFFFEQSFGAFMRSNSFYLKKKLFRMSAEKRIQLRKKMITVFKNTPAAKARDINGFSNIDFIVADFIELDKINPDSTAANSLNFNVTKGQQTRKEIKVYLQFEESEIYRITPQGKLKKVSKDVLVLEDFSY